MGLLGCLLCGAGPPRAPEDRGRRAPAAAASGEALRGVEAKEESHGARHVAFILAEAGGVRASSGDFARNGSTASSLAGGSGGCERGAGAGAGSGTATPRGVPAPPDGPGRPAHPDEGLVLRAALPHQPRKLPVVSRASLRAAFHRSSRAIVVLRVTDRAPTGAGAGPQSPRDAPAARGGWPHEREGSGHSACGGGGGGGAGAGRNGNGSGSSRGSPCGSPRRGPHVLLVREGAAASSAPGQQAAPPPDRPRAAGARGPAPSGGGASRRASRQDDGPSFAVRAASAHALRARSVSAWEALDGGEPQRGDPAGGDDGPPQFRAASASSLPGAGAPADGPAAPRAAPGLPRRRTSASGGERRASYGGAVDPSQSEHLARLEPVYLNRALQSALDVRTLEEYTFTQEKQLLRNPMLVLLLENCVRRLLAGKATSVRQYLPYFSSPATRAAATPGAGVAQFMALQITACGFLDEEDATVAPALFLCYAPASQLEITSQLKRDHMALAHIPSMVTVIANDGRVLHQNGGSVAYMGFLLGSGDGGGGCFGCAGGLSIADAAHPLRRLFAREPAALEDLMATTAAGKASGAGAGRPCSAHATWIGIVRMQPQLDLTEPPPPEDGGGAAAVQQGPDEAAAAQQEQAAAAAYQQAVPGHAHRHHHHHRHQQQQQQQEEEEEGQQQEGQQQQRQQQQRQEGQPRGGAQQAPPAALPAVPLSLLSEPRSDSGLLSQASVVTIASRVPPCRAPPSGGRTPDSAAPSSPRSGAQSWADSPRHAVARCSGESNGDGSCSSGGGGGVAATGAAGAAGAAGAPGAAGATGAAGAAPAPSAPRPESPRLRSIFDSGARISLSHPQQRVKSGATALLRGSRAMRMMGSAAAAAAAAPAAGARGNSAPPPPQGEPFAAGRGAARSPRAHQQPGAQAATASGSSGDATRAAPATRLVVSADFAAAAASPDPEPGAGGRAAKSVRRHSAQPALPQHAPPPDPASPPRSPRSMLGPRPALSGGGGAAAAANSMRRARSCSSPGMHAGSSSGAGPPPPGPPLAARPPAALRAASTSPRRPSLSALSRLLTMRRGSRGSEQSAAGSAGQSAAWEAEAECYHEVQASRFQDPVSGEEVTLLVQTDVSGRAAAELQLRRVLDAEHALLEEILPRQVLEAMTVSALREAAAAGGTPAPLLGPGDALKLALHHEQVSILFADIVGFTAMAKAQPPAAVMALLNELFTRFDLLLERHSVYKVETIGDCYMVAGGLGFRSVLQSQVDPLHAQRTLGFAKAMLEAASEVTMPGTTPPAKVVLRVGIHSGPAMSGVVGVRMPRFCLFGDTVNTASRMESTGPPGRIHVSAHTRALIGGEQWVPTGGVAVKGKGVMQTFIFDDTPGAAAAAALRRQSRSRSQRRMAAAAAAVEAAAAEEAAAAAAVAAEAGVPDAGAWEAAAAEGAGAEAAAPPAVEAAATVAAAAEPAAAQPAAAEAAAAAGAREAQQELAQPQAGAGAA
ncbi:hypothetical protein Rsub_07712 [Raphidocelis subcapitata]|uniref:Guanylate cyclase domain-containing protein n=1 Tax=Raphidocelis subcapitata TaxID=307507 RepID=A0A2V0P5J9_9CHLO|nr:hypothetical protein Rsub_07712 [Raphidocelis subcapitata]|eukprot:GBF95128.1 hypothetical protein Rsub_07712 [Raphidocelis subcapitata]